MTNLIPMAGLGNRFFQDKYRVPKPFIPVLGEPMFLAAARSFPSADRYIFICRQEHVARYKIAETLRRFSRPAEIVTVDAPTQGQACTCLLAQDKWDPADGLFIASCDYQMIYDETKYQNLWNDPSVDVIIWTFKIGSIKKADPQAFAYCRVENGRVTEIVEKRVISATPENDPAVVGSFTYRRAELFTRGAKDMIAKNIRVNNEFYVGTSINQLIAAGCRVVTFEIENFISFGTPFELMSFHYWQDYFDQLEDHPYHMQRPYPASAGR
ncbi:MAG: NTP transferase domain-containing protein [Candidatus Omnitrophica bacterium]|nr:NTP transferase domain-containing protein [Candidatus Omnitrophota bacterium]